MLSYKQKWNDSGHNEQKTAQKRCQLLKPHIKIKICVIHLSHLLSQNKWPNFSPFGGGSAWTPQAMMFREYTIYITNSQYAKSAKLSNEKQMSLNCIEIPIAKYIHVNDYKTENRGWAPPSP